MSLSYDHPLIYKSLEGVLRADGKKLSIIKNGSKISRLSFNDDDGGTIKFIDLSSMTAPGTSLSKIAEQVGLVEKARQLFLGLTVFFLKMPYFTETLVPICTFRRLSIFAKKKVAGQSRGMGRSSQGTSANSS